MQMFLAKRLYTTLPLPVQAASNQALIKIGKVQFREGQLHPGDLFIHKSTGQRCAVLRSFPTSPRFILPREAKKSPFSFYSKLAQIVPTEQLKKISIKLLLEADERKASEIIAKTIKELGLSANEAVYICVNDITDFSQRGHPFFGINYPLIHIVLHRNTIPFTSNQQLRVIT